MIRAAIFTHHRVGNSSKCIYKMVTTPVAGIDTEKSRIISRSVIELARNAELYDSLRVLSCRRHW